MKRNENEIKYFVYIRKSSDREDAQTLSIDAQKRELQKFAERNNFKIVEILEESASAYKTGRPKFNEMLKRIEKEGYPVFLETNFEGNVGLYEHLGFDLIDETKIPETEIVNWAMIKKP